MCGLVRWIWWNSFQSHQRSQTASLVSVMRVRDWTYSSCCFCFLWFDFLSAPIFQRGIQKRNDYYKFEYSICYSITCPICFVICSTILCGPPNLWVIAPRKRHFMLNLTTWRINFMAHQLFLLNLTAWRILSIPNAFYGASQTLIIGKYYWIMYIPNHPSKFCSYTHNLQITNIEFQRCAHHALILQSRNRTWECLLLVDQPESALHHAVYHISSHAHTQT